MTNLGVAFIGFFELTLARVNYYPALTGTHESQGDHSLVVRKGGKKESVWNNQRRRSLDG